MSARCSAVIFTGRGLGRCYLTQVARPHASGAGWMGTQGLRQAGREEKDTASPPGGPTEIQKAQDTDAAKEGGILQRHVQHVKMVGMLDQWWFPDFSDRTTLMQERLLILRRCRNK